MTHNKSKQSGVKVTTNVNKSKGGKAKCRAKAANETSEMKQHLEETRKISSGRKQEQNYKTTAGNWQSEHSTGERWGRN